MIDVQGIKKNLKPEIKLEYWVWLSLVLGQGSPDVEHVLLKFGSPKVLYDFGQKNGFENIKFLSSQVVQRANRISLDVAKEIVEKCKTNNYKR